LDVLKDITEGAKNATDGFADLDEGAKALVLTALELLAAVAALKGVMGLFTTKGILDVVAMAGPWGLLAAAIAATTGAVALYAYNSSKATAQSIDDSLKSVDAKKNEADEVDKLIQKYQDLEGQAVQNNEVKAEMLDIQRQLASIYPGYVDGLDKEGNKLITNIPLLREINALKAQELEIERQRILMDARTRIPQLEAEQKRLQENVDRNKARLASGDTTKTLRKGADIAAIDMAGQIRKEIIENLEALAASQFEQEMINSIIKGATGSYYDYMEDTLSGKDLRRKLAVGGTGGIVGDTETETVQTGGGTYTNKPLQEALRLLQHKKHMNQIGLEDEIAYLKNVEALHVKTGEERMDITERIYNAENALRDKMLQDSVNWINEKRNLGELSAEQEIAAWNRVLTNQKNNIKAVKEATVNLYKLQKDLREDEVKEHKDSLKDLQDSIKDLYDERIDFIEKESDAKVKAIEEELKLLDREDSGYDYDTKMADLEEQLAYWSVRTGENARQQLADVRKKIAEAEHDREVELKKQGLEDEKEAVEDAADEEKEKWEAAYKDMEKAFSDHNLDIIAQAATYSKEAYKQWYDNYIVPMQEALKNGDAEGYEESVGKVGGSIGGLASHDYGMTDSDYRQFIANGKLWYSASASEQASLQTQNDALRDKYDIPAGEYPAFHSGGQSLTSGLARIIPGEIFFPPSFSTDLKTLIAVSSGITGKVANGDTYNSTDKSVINNFNAPLFNSEKTVFEDDTDETSFARELNRAILSIP
ncbi:MAG TPA: hypothetical protein VMV86_05380, partial [Methanosarcinales archaeon]|nr:hypothetical protein [Methanosarcinales archaeon]